MESPVSKAISRTWIRVSVVESNRLEEFANPLCTLPAPLGQNPSRVEGKDPFVEFEIGTDQVGSNRSPFWTSAFELPKRTMKCIERIFNRAGQELKRRFSVSSCRPKSEGGLGLRRIGDCNMAAMIKHGWKVVTNRVDCIKEHHIRKNSFLDVNLSWNTFGILRSILSCRDRADESIKTIHYWRWFGYQSLE